MATSQNDFFGMNYLSADPYAARTAQMANILSGYMSSTQQKATATTRPDVQQTAQYTEQSTPSWFQPKLDTSQNSLSPEANYAQKSGASAQMVQNPGDEPVQPGYPGWTPENSTIPIPNTSYSGGGGSSDAGEYGRIPTDLGGLRMHLQDQLLNMLNNPKFSPEIRFEDLITQLDPSWNRFNDTLYGGLGAGQQGQQAAYDRLMGLSNASPYQMDFNRVANLWSGMQNGGLDPFNYGMYGALASGQGAQNLQDLAMTGGMQNLQPAMDAIRAQSMGVMQDQLAQIREQYGSRGLGAGTDVSQALATGMSRGVADMNAQQQLLQQQAMQAAAQTRLGASQGIQNWLGGAMNNFTAAQDALNNSRINAFNAGIGGMYNQGQLYNQGIQNQIAAASGASGSAGNYMQGLSSLAPYLGMYPQAAQMNIEANMQRGIDEIIRRSMGPTILPAALNYASAVPAPAQQPLPNNSGGVWGALGALGGAALGAASKPWFLSDREAKEEIEEVDDSLSARLRALPIFTWKYKGDDVKHLGPMAQDFQTAFGVGDGHRIHFSDVLGVLLAVQKEQLANG